MIKSALNIKVTALMEPLQAARTVALCCVPGVHGLPVHADRSDRIHAAVPPRAAGRRPVRPAGATPAHRLHRGRGQHRDRGEVAAHGRSSARLTAWPTSRLCLCFHSGCSSGSRPIRSAWQGRCSSPDSWSGTSCSGRCRTGSEGDPST